MTEVKDHFVQVKKGVVKNVAHRIVYTTGSLG